ncbi:MAG: DUF4143 domain-containing protein [Thermoleophilia bacterium]
MRYRRRTIDDRLDRLLLVAPAIALDGPKGVGKTETAERRADRSWFLDDPDHHALLAANPDFADIPAGTLLVDEWQRFPRIWDVVRRQVDRGAPPGRFLLTGSATPARDNPTHSGAGRILSMRMRPMGIHERLLQPPTVSLGALLSGTAATISGTTGVTLGGYLEAIESSGFPGIMGLPPDVRREQLDAYLLRVIDRDLPDLGFSVRRPDVLRRWLAAYAAASSTTTAYARLLAAATSGEGDRPAKTTTIAYRDHLSALWLLDPVPGWAPSRSPMSRLLQAPKHQLADPALSLRLLGLTGAMLATPRGAHMAGPLFESLATLTVRVAAQASSARVGHLRTRNGDREVDLVVEGPEGQIIGIEVKLSATVDDRDVRHLRWLRERLPEDVVDLVAITSGSTAYRRADGIAVVPLALLGA